MPLASSGQRRFEKADNVHTFDIAGIRFAHDDTRMVITIRRGIRYLHGLLLCALGFLISGQIYVYSPTLIVRHGTFTLPGAIALLIGPVMTITIAYRNHFRRLDSYTLDLSTDWYTIGSEEICRLSTISQVQIMPLKDKNGMRIYMICFVRDFGIDKEREYVVWCLDKNGARRIVEVLAQFIGAEPMFD